MVGAILTNKAPVTLDDVTPLARLTGEYELIVVPADSPIKTMGDLVAKLKADPGSVSWGGGSTGGTDHILAGLIAKARRRRPDQGQLHRPLGRRRGAVVDPRRPRHRRRQRLRGVRAADRGRQAARRSRSPPTSACPGIDVPTLKEQGVDVVAGQLARRVRAAADPRQGQEGARRSDRQDGREPGLEGHAARSAAGSTSTSPPTSSPRSSQEDRAKVETTLKDVGLVQLAPTVAPRSARPAKRRRRRAIHDPFACTSCERRERLLAVARTTPCGRPSRRALLADRARLRARLGRPGPGRDQGLEIIAPAGPGGGYDQLARATQEMLEKAGLGVRRAGAEHPRCRRHDRARAVRDQGLAQPRPAGGRPRPGRRHADQQVAGHAGAGGADGAADRRVSTAGGRGGLADQDAGRPDRQVQSRPGLGQLGRFRAGLARPHPERLDRQGGRRRRHQDELHRRRCRRRDAGAGHGRPPDGRDRRPQRDGAADPGRASCGRWASPRPSGCRASTSRPSRSRVWT